MKYILLVVAAILAAPACQARIITVNDDCSADFDTIQAAIDDANDGDTVIIQPIRYTGTGNRDISFLGKAITVQSIDPNDPCVVESTVIDCNGTTAEPHRGFYFHSGEDTNSIVDGLTITNGADFFGGGIYCQGSSPTIKRCKITGNYSRWRDGGGICCHYSCPQILDCIIIENRADDDGGGIYCQDSSNAVVSNCVIRDNTAIRDGGGVVSWYSSKVILKNCTIIRNKAGRYGGGLRGFNDSPALLNCLVVGNSAGQGGGISVFNGSDFILRNCTIADNIAIRGSAIYLDHYTSVRLRNSILYRNFPNQIFLESYSKVFTEYTNIEDGWSGVGNINTDPCFVLPSYWADANDLNIVVEPNDPNAVWISGDYNLRISSPCIDTGDPNYVTEANETDLNGNPRVVDGDRDSNAVVDMGAYEYQNTAPVADAGPDQTVYAWIDGIVDVNLDGSGSFDDDNDTLTYKWSWTIDANTYEANGVNPTIELPVGQYVISLIVNDGLIDSEPNEVNITVIGPIEANLNITPKVLNCKGFQPRITAMLRLPKGITKDQIDSNEPILLYPGQIEADKVWISRDFNYKCRAWSVTIFASFDKDELMDAIPNNGQVELVVVGRLKTGQFFFGSDNIRVICPGHWPRHKPWCDHRWDRRCRGPCNFRH